MMSRIRFNHVFTLLMALAAASSLFIPTRLTSAPRAIGDNFFAPLTVPARQLAAWLGRRLGAADPSRPALLLGHPAPPASQLEDEVLRLRTEVARLSAELDHLRRLNAQLERMGEAGQYCKPFAVLFSDSARRQSIMLKAAAVDKVAKGMAVLTPEALVGRVVAVGVGGTHVRLITDRESWVKVKFLRYDAPSASYTPLATEHAPICQGAGSGRMVILNLNQRDVQRAGITRGTLAVLDDPDWPSELQGWLPLGVVQHVGAQAKAPLFAEIAVEPPMALMRLPSVMVMIK
jgi:hypothetical protein